MYGLFVSMANIKSPVMNDLRSLTSYYTHFISQVRELETELDKEQRRHLETSKTSRLSERRLKEIAFQVDEDRKHQERLQAINEKLNAKIKTLKTQIEESVSIYSNQ